VAATVASALLLAFALVACGSSSSSKVAVGQTCGQVAAVLSDGPDPGADPVGYADAQILPLRRIHTSQQALREAIDRLASAYQELSSTNGDSRLARTAVAEASHRIDSFCPGAAQ
jgi:hypothetical protein